MPEPVRIVLRLLGLVLLLAGVACAVLLVWPGPRQIAELLGASCARSRHGTGEQCSLFDAADLLWTGFWVASIAGAALLLITRPPGRKPLTLDLRHLRLR
ncbi:MAG: hypothetical protein ACSLFA_07385 [Mycobacterium sp.]